MQFVLYTTLLEAGQNFCKLTGLGGDQEGVPCVLPFRFKSILYNTCTNASDPHGKFWCSTRTFLNGSHMEHSGKE